MALPYSVLRFFVLISSLLILASVFFTIPGKAEEEYYDHEPGIGTGAGGGTGTGTGTAGAGEAGEEYDHHYPEVGTGIAGAGKGGDDYDHHEPEIGTGSAAGAGYDPAQTVAKALLCFNDKYIYSSCEESCRLTSSGNLDVPSEKTEIYCSGPCLKETNLVLDCIHNILTHFVFYNKATIQDIRDTIHAGCGYGPERGDFNVAEHMQVEEDKAQKVANQIVVVLGLMFIGYGLL